LQKFLKDTSNTAPIHTPFFYGWIIVIIAAMGMFFSGPGQTFTMSVFIDAYIRDFGWSRSFISSLYSFATLSSGLILFSVGRFVDRYGQRLMMTVVAILLGLACLWNSFVSGPIMLFIGFFMLRLFGQGSMTLLPQTLVPQWFFRQRGRAISLMTLGIIISSTVLPPLNTWMIQTWNWPFAWRVWFVLVFFFYAPIAYFFVRNKPEDIGLLPDNAQVPKIKKKTQTKNKHESDTEDNWTLKEARQTKTFWLMLFCVIIPAMVNTGLIFHLVSIFGESGISKSTSALVLSLMALVSFPMNFVAGIILEKFKANGVLGFIFIAQIMAMLILLLSHNTATAILFGIVRGVVQGFEAITLGIIWPNFFGRKHLGSINGVVATVTVLGSAFGPLPFGIAYDLFGGYSQIIIIMMLFPLLGSIAAFAAKQPQNCLSR